MEVLLMKTLEVESLQSGIDYTVKDIEKFYEQKGEIAKAVKNFHSLDGALDGKGGEAIRAFYRDCHEPFLVLLHQSMIDYQTILNQMSEAIDSFESNESGYISQDFLENDVEDALDTVKETAIGYTDEANSIIDSVSDIVSIDQIDESDLVDDVQKGQEDAEEIVEELYALDEEQVKAMESVKENLNDMRNFISDLETLFKDGDLSVSNYDVTAVLGLESFHSVSEGVYGEGGIIGFILNKYQNGEAITAIESDTLYKYFQTIVLDDKTKKELEEVAGFINKTDIDKLTEHLNEKVVVSDDALEEEMMLVQAYLFLGNKSPSATDLDDNIRAKMEAYMMLLKDYHLHIVERNEVIMVGQIDYEINHKGVSGYHIESVIKSYNYENNDMMNKQEFRDWMFFDTDNYMMTKIQFSSVTYATGGNASSNISKSELNKLKEEYAWYDVDFIVTATINKIVSKLAEKANLSSVVDVIKTAVGADSEKKEMG